jgi:hypothetical protein
MYRTRGVDVIIAAGGYGRRLGLSVPKSLLPVHGIPMLIYTIKSIIGLGARRVIVCNDRIEWHYLIQRVCSPYRVEVIRDNSFASTLLLARSVLPPSSKKTLFLYGHAPRPKDHLRRMLEEESPIVATETESSSKRCRIHWGETRFLEPPYVLESALLASSHEASWLEFFSNHRLKVSVTSMAGPCEFNHHEEIGPYRRYVLNYTSQSEDIYNNIHS